MCGVLKPRFPAIVRMRLKGPTIGDVYLPPEAIDHLLAENGGELIFPAEAPLPTGSVVSRFLAKAALEKMAQRVISHAGGVDYLANEPQLDSIRSHARRGSQPHWPVNVRRIYGENRRWIDSKGAEVQVLHESDILKTETNEYYYILALFGLEFAINFGGAEIDGYRYWLSHHGMVSPLYYGKNEHGDLR